MTMTVHNNRPRQFHRTSNGENPSSGYRDMGPASLTAARTITTIPLQPGGLRGKMQVTLPNKALWKIITVWRQSAPLTPQIILEMSDSRWRQSILSPSDAIGKFSTQQNFQGHQWQRTCMIQHNQTKVKLMPIVLKNCNISHKKLPKWLILTSQSSEE